MKTCSHKHSIREFLFSRPVLQEYFHKAKFSKLVMSSTQLQEMLKGVPPDDGKRCQILGSECTALGRINVPFGAVTVVSAVRMGATLFHLHILSGIWKSTNALQVQ